MSHRARHEPRGSVYQIDSPHQNDGTVECTGEVEGGVSVTLGGGSLTEKTSHDTTGSCAAERVRGAHSLRHLSR